MNWMSFVKRAVCVVFVLAISKMAFADGGNNVIFHYDGRADDWILNTKVVALKANDFNLTQLRSANQHVETVDVVEDAFGSFVTFKLDDAATREDWTNLQLELASAYPSGKRLVAIRKVTDNQMLAKKDIFIDNQLFLVFDRPVSREEITALEAQYNMTWVNQREVGTNGKRTYIFSSNNMDPALHSAALATRIYNENDFIAVAQPNRVNWVEPNGGSYDVHIDKAWHVNNDGQQLSCGNLYGQHNADAKVDDVWALGITGQTTRVGVIDFYGFDMNHPDLQGQFVAGWDCIQNQPYDQSNFYFTTKLQAHATAVSGIIGAIGNNNEGAAGVAYDTKMVPFLINGSEAEVVLALQKALDPAYDVDVINMSFGSYFESPAIYNEIKNVVNLGRDGKGMVVIASHGNDNYDDVSFPQFPSGHAEVISVGASTPDDRSKIPSDDWNTSSEWGTNYGQRLTVMAPGVCIFTTDVSGPDGYGSGDYIGFQKTSAAAPVATGVAALLLSADPNLTWEEVMERIIASADKTYSTGTKAYNYNYDANNPGHSKEMGYGRVNALKAVGVTVGVEDVKTVQDNWNVTIVSPAEQKLEISYNMGAYKEVSMDLFDMSGKRIASVNLNNGSGFIAYDLQRTHPGMYFARFVNGEGEVLETQKFVKTR